MDPNPSTPPAAPATPHEIELKLFVPPTSAGRIWTHPLVVTHAIGPLRVARVDNRYFDTADRALASRRMALRLRRTGGRWLQTLKTGGEPGGALNTRGEWETEVAGPAFEWAKLRDTPLAAIGTTRSLAPKLRPLFTTDFRRESRHLRLPDGTEIEFAYDVGTIATGRGRGRRTLPIREVELEVVRAGSGDAHDALLRFAWRLAEDLPLVPLSESKAARGYRLVDGVVPHAARPTLPTAERERGSLRHLADALAACNEALLANAHQLVELGPDAPLADRVEPVHQARVALRRMRSALSTFDDVARGRRVAALGAGLKTIAATFGEVRDQDVFATSTMKRLADVAADDAEGRAAVAALRGIVAARRDEAHRALLERLFDGPFGATTLFAMRVIHRFRSRDGGGPPLAECADGWLASQRSRVVRRARRIAVLDPEARHRLRIEVKRLRYALDLLGGLHDPDRVERFVDAVTELQDRLGRMNDATVAKQFLQSFPPSAERDLVFGRYAGWLEHHIRRQLPKVAASSVDFEIVPAPWSSKAPRTFG